MSAPAFSIEAWLDGRAHLRAAFLQSCGWADAAAAPVGDDCAFRRYLRLTKPDGRTAIMMEAVPDGADIATPGHKITDFLRIGAHFREIGLHTPKVYEADADTGYALLEDFGGTSFRAAMDTRVMPRETLYALATDVLSHLRDHGGDAPLDLPDYYQSHVHTARRRLVDWYLPAVMSARVEDGLASEYLAVWDHIELSLPPVPTSILHIDYHFENLMWLPGEDGLQRCGILDFQGAMRGPAPYDLANLLEDARVDVPADLRVAMLNRYCANMDADARALFMPWYRVLATQFHCRVIGQFIRLAIHGGKPRYLAHIPRVAGYMREGLKDPVLAPLAVWCDREGIDFAVVDGFNPEKISKLIRSDAF